MRSVVVAAGLLLATPVTAGAFLDTVEERSLDARSRVALAEAKSPEDYAYEPVLRKVLLATRPHFDPADGLQQWERALLAMDPNGATAPGR